jgi:molecular chaperone GrpE
MADRPVTAPAAGERPNGNEPEARAASAVPEDLESLRSRATGAEQKRDEYLDLLQRTRADFENYRKRTQRDVAEARRYAHTEFARSLLPVLDNLQRALATSWKQADKEPLIQGVDLVRSQMLQLFGRFGISPINALGQPFDPHVHEAVQQLPRDDVSPGTVVEVLEPGYLLHERVLRPARVGVAAPPTRGPASS